MAGAEPQIDLQNFSIPPAGSLDMDDLIDVYESIRPWLPTPRLADTRRADRMLAVLDHVDALLLVASQGQVGRSYCVGGHGERSNREVVETICALLDELRPQRAPHARLITRVNDRPGHDRRYAIDPGRITAELGWQPRYAFRAGLEATVRWCWAVAN